jgi:hypothetical protein
MRKRKHNLKEKREQDQKLRRSLTNNYGHMHVQDLQQQHQYYRLYRPPTITPPLTSSTPAIGVGMSNIGQHTKFLSQEQHYQENLAMMLAGSTKPKREG